MTSAERRVRFITSYLRNARERIELAKLSSSRGFYNNAVRLCQEAVELCLKSVLRLYGIEYPRAHDVGHVLRQYSNLFPDWFRERIPEIARMSRDLCYNRGPAMYGDEDAEVPPEELYDETDAAEAIKGATLVYQLSTRLLGERVGREADPPAEA